MGEITAAAQLARQSLEHYLRTGTVLPVPRDVAKELAKAAGVFVSLKKQGQLRGCIGTFQPTTPHAAAEIIYNAIKAGTADPRFSPVQVQEMNEITISVDVLGAPEQVSSLDELDAQQYGVIVRSGQRTGLLLPMLEGVDTPKQQVGIAMDKAGISPEETIDLFRFTVIRYT